MKNYLVCTIKPWHLEAYESYANSGSGNWTLISSREQFSIDLIKTINPRYIFFPHWSWIVPKEIIDSFECVCFHSSDVPYGRGGSPIQNLIIRGHQMTKVSALRMTDVLDAGPVYLKKDLSLAGHAQAIYEQSAQIIVDMIKEIVQSEPQPIPQQGDAVIFKRRQDNDNLLPLDGDLEHLYNHIRMLDAESYPNSFLNHGEFKLEFSQAKLENEELIAHVKISLKKCQNQNK